MVPKTELFVVKVTGVVSAPLHTTWSEGSLTCPEGLTVIVKLLESPTQLTDFFSKEGVTVMVATTGEVPLLTAVNARIFPVPPAARPMLVVLLVQV